MASKQPYKVLLVMVVTVAMMLATVCSSHAPSIDEEVIIEEINDNSRRTQDVPTAEKAREGKEGSESWTEWAKEKLSDGLEFEHDDDIRYSTKKASDAAYDTTKQTKDIVEDSACGTGVYTAEKAKQMKDTAGKTINVAKEKAFEATKSVGDMTYDAAKAAKDKAYEATIAGKEKAKNAAKEKAYEATMAVKDKACETKKVAEEKAKEAKENAEQKTKEVKDKAAHNAKEKTKESLEAAKHKYSHKVKENVVGDEEL